MDSAGKSGMILEKGAQTMNHQVKLRKHPRRRKLRWGFAFSGLWAAALAAMVFLPTLPAEEQSGGTIRLNYRGLEQTVHGAGKTLGQLLESLGLELGEGDVTSHSLNSVLTDGMRVTVTAHDRRREEFTLALLPETEYILDEHLPWGVEKTIQPGVPGELRCVAIVDYVNGEEIARQITQKSLISDVEPTVVAIGIREDAAPRTGDGCIWLPNGQMLNYRKALTAEATAFTAADGGGTLRARAGTVLVDGAFIPEGSRLYICAADGSWDYGVAMAVDSGTVEGSRIDLYFDDAAGAAEFGRKECIVYFLGGKN